MLVTVSVPDESVGDVMGDLSSRRGRPLGTEGVGGMTEVKAEVPMAEMLTYAPDLRSITGGQGEYTLEFLRYEEVPAHLAQKVVDEAQRRRRRSRTDRTERRAGPARPLLRPRPCDVMAQVPRTSRPTRRTSPATSAGARCCAASTPRASSRRASAARSASCAPRARSTRAGSASPAATTSRCATRAATAAGARSSTACARAASAPARSATTIAAEEASPAPPSAARAPPRARARARAPPEPVAEAPRRPRHVRAVPTNADLKMERALEVFNASDHTRTVGGVARSLGAPDRLRAPAARAPERRLDHRDVGALAGTATRSTSPTRPAASGATRRATSCPSSPTPSSVANAAADDRGGLHLS